MQRNFFFFIFIILVSCETVVDVNVPKSPPKLTLNSTFTTDSIWKAHISLSRYILDEHLPFEPVDDAEVFIFHNGKLLDTLRSIGDGNYSSIHNKKPVTGESYEIRASSPTLGQVQSTSYLPASTPLKKIEVEFENGPLGKFGISTYNYIIKATFQDDGTTEDYYDFSLLQEYKYWDFSVKDTVIRMGLTTIFSDGTTFGSDNQEEMGVIFDDLLFNGKEVTVPIKRSIIWGSTFKFILYFRRLSKDLYNYKTASFRQANMPTDPFVQPVHVYNNISNGYGIFGGYSISAYEIKK
jgi:hypothetical protein